MLKARRKTFAASLVLAAACSQRTTSQSINVDPRRDGSSLSPVDVNGKVLSGQYIDVQPSLSDDGTRVAFVSGRDTQAAKPTLLHAYKAAWPAGAAPQAPTRATAAAPDLGSEQGVRISPDGLWLVVVALKAGVVDLYVQDFAGAKPAVKVPDANAIKTAVEFSPDSKLLSWISGDGTAAKSGAMVIALGDGTASALAQPVALAAGLSGVQQLVWQPVASGYQLVTATQTPAKPGVDASATWDYMPYAFASAAAAASAKAGAPLLTGAIVAPGVRPAASAKDLLVARKVLASEGFFQSAHVPVRDEPAFIAGGTLQTFAAPMPYAQPLGYQYVAGALTRDGNNAIVLERAEFNCQGTVPQQETDLTYAGVIKVLPTDPASYAPPKNPTLAQFIPRLMTAPIVSGTPTPYQFDVAHDYCDRPVHAGGYFARIDSLVEDLAVNGAATAAVFRAAYVTRFTTHFDGLCNLKAGDQEVQLIDVTAAGATIYPLSANQPPVTVYGDDNRGGYDACVL